jgi:hypothetical protein
MSQAEELGWARDNESVLEDAKEAAIPLREPAFPHFLFSAREFALSSARDVVRTSLMKPER